MPVQFQPQTSKLNNLNDLSALHFSLLSTNRFISWQSNDGRVIQCPKKRRAEIDGYTLYEHNISALYCVCDLFGIAT
jgi:hypothetical protein